MELKTFLYILLNAMSFVFIQCDMYDWRAPGNDEEGVLCNGLADSANNETVETVLKERELACQVLCVYSDGRNETVNSPENQACSLMTQKLSSGKCKEGKCAILGLFSVN